jgi:hypothetical protein
MLFNSLEFVAFFIIVACGYHLCPLAWRRAYLLVTSYAFYCTWSVVFAVLLLGVTAVTFVLGMKVGSAGSDAERRRSLVAGILLLLLPLAAFKYLGGLNVPLVDRLRESPWASHLAAMNLVGLVGISYYTLKLISYLIDVYWERIKPCREFAAVATYAAFFPQILSGPIQRAGDFIGQMENITPMPPAMLASGLRLLLFGFFKKLVVADRLGVFVDQVFTDPRGYSGAMLVAASYLFAIQLYADFSGLTDIARGAACVLGFSSPKNFDSPFYAENIQDFWRRWHMTLTSWLGDYLFVPLRLALRDWGQVGLVLSLTVNMLAIGIWHGPRWSYVVFGLVHAAYLVGSTLTSNARKLMLQHSPVLRKAHSITGPLITFHMVVASFVFSRARSLEDAWYILSSSATSLVAAIPHIGSAAAHRGLVAHGHVEWAPGEVVIAFGALLMMEIVHFFERTRPAGFVSSMSPWIRWPGYYALIFSILIFGEPNSKQFIYVKF